MDYNSTGSAIRFWRTQAGISRGDLALSVFGNKEADALKKVKGFETDLVTPRPETATRIAEALGVSLEDLLYGVPFSMKLREARKKKGYSQKKLGELAGLHEMTIQSYEIHKKIPKFEVAALLADLLDCKVEYLYNYHYPSEGEISEQIKDLQEKLQVMEDTDGEDMVSLRRKNARYLNKIEQLRLSHKKEMESLEAENQQLKAAIRQFMESLAPVM